MTPRRPSPISAALGAVAGALPGALLGAAAGVTGVVRRTKPLHPAGMVGDGLLHVTEPRPDLGVPLLAERGDRPCLVRWSRAMGLPDGWPDFEGLALRFAAETAGGGDLLLASTGTCKVARHVLLLRGAGRHGVLSSLIPVASQAGPLLFRATPVDDADPPQRYRISVAVGLSDWDDVAVLDAAWGPDQPIRFDPVTRPLAGIRQYAGVTALREPAYALARKAASAKT